MDATMHIDGYGYTELLYNARIYEYIRYVGKGDVDVEKAASYGQVGARRWQMTTDGW